MRMWFFFFILFCFFLLQRLVGLEDALLLQNVGIVLEDSGALLHVCPNTSV